MSHEELKGSVRLGPNRFDETETVNSGAKDAYEIMIIGFEITEFCGAIVGRSKRMDESGFEARITKSSHDHQMVSASHFDADDGILDIMFLNREFECLQEPLTRGTGTKKTWSLSRNRSHPAE